MQNEDDELFNQIMDRITSAIYKPNAIEDTVDENYDTIQGRIQDLKKGDVKYPPPKKCRPPWLGDRKSFEFRPSRLVIYITIRKNYAFFVP